ncbi:VWA domain-containing protein [soil metagenome]
MVFRFLHPEFLWLLALLPLLALLKGKRGTGTPGLRFSSTGAAALIAGARRSRAGMVTGLLRMLGLAALIIALARPQFGQGRTEVEASGIDIILAIDVSSSMEALDFTIGGERTNRLDAVKGVVASFIEDRDSDRIGIVAFAARPYMVSPLTLDHDWLAGRLEDVTLGTVEDGTAIGSAVASAVNRLREQEAKSRIVILLTDGMNNAGKVSPEVAAEAAQALGIKVYTIGAGTRGEAPFPTTDPFGRTTLATIKVDIDEETLTRVAEMTGARYFRATDTDSLAAIYAEINQLETTTRTIREFSEYQELFAYALVPGLLLLFSELALTNTKFRRLP